MRILFICGTLEPGRDGVGDYTRKLACELIQQGHQIKLIAIMDKFTDKVITHYQECELIKIPSSRLPFNKGYQSNCKEAKKLIDLFRPDWISLQYVPFSFGNKGIHCQFGYSLVNLAESCKFHIMFHEMWVGRHKGVVYKKKILSFIQQVQIKNLIKIIKPNLIHTHLPLYQSNLRTIGAESFGLPLFSNISAVANPMAEKPSKVFKIGFFSQISTAEAVIKFINDFCAVLKEKKFLPELVIIGGDMDKMGKHVAVFKEACPNLERIYATGFLEEGDVSEILADCSLGISPIPFHALGKSGSVAAFLSHGIPVAAPVVPMGHFKKADSFFYRNESNSILTEPDWNNFQLAKASALLVYKEIHISTIANLFYSELQNSH